MKRLRQTGIFALACSAILFVVAGNFYANAVTTAKELARHIDGVDYDSVRVPIQTLICGLAGVVLLIAGARMLFESFQKPKPVDGEMLGKD